MKRMACLGILLLFLASCSPQWEVPPLVVGPDDASSEQPPVPSYALPEGPPARYGFGLAWTPETPLNPLAQQSALNTALLPLMYEGLFAVDPVFEIRPRLCVSAETEDRQTVTLRLANAVFSDGNPLTAEDVVYSFQQARAAASPYAAKLQSVSSVTAETDGSVLLKLNGPHARFAALLDFPILRKNADPGLPAPPGTGSYVLRYDDGNTPVLTPNEFRSGSGALLPYRIDLLDARDAVNLSFYFQYRHISAIGYDFNDPILPGLRSGFERYDYPSAVTQYIGVSSKTGPLLEPTVRKALSLALDREGLCREVFGGDAEASCLPLPPSSALCVQALTEPYTFDPVAALRLLGDAGCTDNNADGVLEWPSGRQTIPLSFTLLVCSDNPSREEAARRFAADLAPTGIRLTVTALPWKSYSQAVQNGLYDLYWAQAELSADFDMGVFLSPDGALNYGGTVPPDAAALLDTLNTAPPDGEKAAWKALEELWLNEAPFITVCFNRKSLLTQRGMFREPTPAAGNLYYGFTGWGLVGDENE